ncbi:tRNA glutamyl-Q(34) synthetase GluQRS [Pseudorhodobacter sp. W20_MBD10_FR17]|uniref:tRNA glutamyl-Q(34) synthetase GluQRS n=1 Tax=Pseudorhodobacter sp. W20_MBD10_FR17 TaxID=3240266 RepID=UPI003F9E0FDB
MAFVTRFAPSPTGPLHLGHAYSALLAHGMAQAADGTFLLRIEDIDRGRCRPEWEAQIYEDLGWLGLTWPLPVMRQSDRLASYSAALDALWAQGLVYACTCTRRDIEAAMSAPQEGAAPQFGPDGMIYPGTCRATPNGPRMGEVLRLNTASALESVGHLNFLETGPRYAGHIALANKDLLASIGDIVIARRDMATSYHLSVVLDDAAQSITHVVRGEDLFEATAIHVLLQRLLGLPTPDYHHHGLIRDDQGKRLAKRDDARALSKYRAEGYSPADIRGMVGL